jgi:hypothetical protein
MCKFYSICMHVDRMCEHDKRWIVGRVGAQPLQGPGCGMVGFVSRLPVFMHDETMCALWGPTESDCWLVPATPFGIGSIHKLVDGSLKACKIMLPL